MTATLAWLPLSPDRPCAMSINRSGSAALMARLPSRPTKTTYFLHEFLFPLEHEQVAAVAQQLQLRLRQQFPVRLGVGRRDELIVVAPQQQDRTLNPVQPLRQFRAVGPLPHQA